MPSITTKSPLAFNESLLINTDSSVQNELVIKKGVAYNYDEYINQPRFKDIKHKQYVPAWDANDSFAPLEEFEHVDRGLFANLSLTALFPRKEFSDEYTDSTQVKLLTPKFGSEVRGVQISELSDAGKDELALYVAQRGVVIFRDQDLKDKPVEEVAKLSHYYGRPHIHPTAATAVGHPEVFLVYTEHDTNLIKEITKDRTGSLTWHSDVSYEKQPPGTTFLAFLQGPKEGGDTIFSDSVQAYERLSPAFQKTLEGLKAIHSSSEQISFAKARGGINRREAVATEHPIVRVHPVTKKRSLFVNPGFTRSVVGFKKEESDNLLKFLYEQTTGAGDIQIRASWEEGTIIIWDNRRLVHSAIPDWEEEVTRHAFRITPQAEVPVGTS